MQQTLKETMLNELYPVSQTQRAFGADAGIEKCRQQIVMAMSSALREDASLFFLGKLAVPQRPNGGEPLGQWTQRWEAKD
ncbi:MAG: hypothetical protein JWP80_4791 [Pseudomonas sp.]|nr:hypothetical protein [Pseudomonas sp.]